LETKQKRKAYWQERQTLASVRKKRKQALNDKILQQKVDDTKSNRMFLLYQTGMDANLPDGFCHHCGKQGHKRKNHKDCTANIKNGLQATGSNVSTKEGEANQQPKNVTVPVCKSCGNKGHKTKAHLSCPKNKKNMQVGP
jgi:hypothetical protein